MRYGSKAFVKAMSKYGPGGRHCICCGPAPKWRKRHDRTVKRRIRQLIKKDISNSIGE